MIEAFQFLPRQLWVDVQWSDELALDVWLDNAHLELSEVIDRLLSEHDERFERVKDIGVLVRQLFEKWSSGPVACLYDDRCDETLVSEQSLCACVTEVNKKQCQ